MIIAFEEMALSSNARFGPNSFSYLILLDFYITRNIRRPHYL